MLQRCRGHGITRALLPLGGFLILTGLLWSVLDQMNKGEYNPREVPTEFIGFGESLAATGDRFAMLGFSARRRDPVRVHRLKDFEEGYGPQVRRRIAAIRSGDYTRLGAGIRHASADASEPKLWIPASAGQVVDEQRNQQHQQRA